MKKFLCFALVIAMAVAATGCGGSNRSTGLEFSSNMPTGEVSYPLDTDETLTFFCELPSMIATDVTNFGETDFAQYLEKETGIKIEYKHPVAGSGSETLQLMLASGNMTDMIQTSWLSLGPQSYIDTNQIYALDAMMKQGYTPHFSKFLEENADIQKMVKTDTGSYYGFPFVRNNDELLISTGLMLRSDWLKEAGLEVPETIEDWDAVFAAFKERCETPYASNSFDSFASGFDAYYGEYVKDGKVVYGPIEDNFKAFLTKLNEWYNKGYIDQNYAIIDGKISTAAILNGTSGVTFAAGGGGMGAYLNEKKGEAYDLSAAPYPSAKRGEPAKFGNKELKYGLGAVTITSSCKNPALAARFLDFGYSEKGHMVYNFGEEGKSYNMIDGYPTYVESITNNAAGKSMSNMLAHNCLAGVYGPFVQDLRYLEQYYSYPQQQNAVKVWSSCEMEKYRLPQLILTTDENDGYTEIMGEIKTYVAEMYNNFITGKASLDQFDEFVHEVKSMGIDEALAYKQTAYERYLER